MKTTRKLLQKYPKILVLNLALALNFGCSHPTNAETHDPQNVTVTEEKQHIKIALLLDTSNSMDGLIEQTKSQLWTIVNELSTAKCDGDQTPDLKIALYEYGNDRLSANSGYIRQVSSLTSDLDKISEKLFALSTKGGEEYCGQVITTSLNQLEWGTNENDLKMIFIAGNEPFTQGSVYYKDACELANKNDVIVNTIFCGNFQEGISSSWKNGADLTKGSYMAIEQNQKTVFIESPYDNHIDSLNTVLNDTYIPYGTKGNHKKQAQEVQDLNALSYSRANKVKRTITKSSGYYKNDEWDLVDATEKSESIVEELEESALPQEMKDMDTDERKTYVKEKADKRIEVQTEIKKLSEKRKEYVINKKQELPNKSTLDQALIEAIKVQAKDKGITF